MNEENKKTIELLDEILPSKEDEDIDVKKLEQKEYSDNCNVMMIIPKKKYIHNTMKLFFKVNEQKKKFDFDEGTINCKFSIGYLKKVLDILASQVDEDYLDTTYVKISLRKDYPIQLETDDFKIMLAPVVEE